jgi:hypothetical protein
MPSFLQQMGDDELGHQVMKRCPRKFFMRDFPIRLFLDPSLVKDDGCQRIKKLTDSAPSYICSNLVGSLMIKNVMQC